MRVLLPAAISSGIATRHNPRRAHAPRTDPPEAPPARATRAGCRRGSRRAAERGCSDPAAQIRYAKFDRGAASRGRHLVRVGIDPKRADPGGSATFFSTCVGPTVSTVGGPGKRSSQRAKKFPARLAGRVSRRARMADFMGTGFRRRSRRRASTRIEPAASNVDSASDARLPGKCSQRAVESTNWFPSLSLNIAKVPQCSFFGGPRNSTPRAFNSS